MAPVVAPEASKPIAKYSGRENKENIKTKEYIPINTFEGYIKNDSKQTNGH